MKCVILCGGKGTRLKELTEELPKPLINVGDKPILSHIMKRYSDSGFNEFILCLGYKGEKIKEYFEKNNNEGWDILFANTGEESKKTERLVQIEGYLGSNEDFFLAYGDDVSSVNIEKLLKFHKKNKKIATITAVHPKNPYGILELKINQIINFKEKPQMEEWINGGYMVLNKKIFDYIDKGDELEKEVFEKLIEEEEIYAFKHKGFWKSMSTFKDVQELNDLWKNKNVKW